MRFIQLLSHTQHVNGVPYPVLLALDDAGNVWLHWLDKSSGESHWELYDGGAAGKLRVELEP